MNLKKASAYFLIGSLFLLSCGNKQTQEITTPDYLIPEDTFKMALVQLHLLEGYVSRNPDKLKGLDTIYEKKSIKILNDLQLSETRFKKSFDYYLNQPTEFDKLYDEVLEELTKQQAELMKNNRESIENEEKQVED